MPTNNRQPLILFSENVRLTCSFVTGRMASVSDYNSPEITMKTNEAKKCRFRSITALLCIMLMAIQADLTAAVAAGAAELALAMSFTHSAPKHVQPGKRIIISSKITDPSGLKLARCYFRADAEADYVFVPMEAGAKNTFKAVLPAVSDNAQTVQYRLLAVNNTGQIAKTNEFSVAVKSVKGPLPKWQQAERGEPIHVGIEVEPQEGGISQKVTGFSDNITVDLAESSLRFMLVSGAGLATGIAASSGSSGAAAGATATSAGTVGGTASAATSGSGTIMGMKASTFWWVAAGAAVVIGTGLALSGGGGGGGSNDGSIAVKW
jgi:hypothetical protein